MGSPAGLVTESRSCPQEGTSGTNKGEQAPRAHTFSGSHPQGERLWGALALLGAKGRDRSLGSGPCCSTQSHHTAQPLHFFPLPPCKRIQFSKRYTASGQLGTTNCPPLDNSGIHEAKHKVEAWWAENHTRLYIPPYRCIPNPLLDRPPKTPPPQPLALHSICQG